MKRNGTPGVYVSERLRKGRNDMKKIGLGIMAVGVVILITMLLCSCGSNPVGTPDPVDSYVTWEILTNNNPPEYLPYSDWFCAYENAPDVEVNFNTEELQITPYGYLNEEYFDLPEDVVVTRHRDGVMGENTECVFTISPNYLSSDFAIPTPTIPGCLRTWTYAIRLEGMNNGQVVTTEEFFVTFWMPGGE